MWLEEPWMPGQAEQEREGAWDTLFTLHRRPCLKGRCFRSPGMCGARPAVYFLSCKGREVGGSLQRMVSLN